MEPVKAASTRLKLHARAIAMHRKAFLQRCSVCNLVGLDDFKCTPSLGSASLTFTMSLVASFVLRRRQLMSGSYTKASSMAMTLSLLLRSTFITFSQVNLQEDVFGGGHLQSLNSQII